MTEIDERICNPVSTAELERRWNSARESMRASGIDALVVQGTNNYSGGGYFRWFTDQPVLSSNPRTAIFPAKGLMTLVEQGPWGEATRFDGATAPNRGIGHRVFTPSYPSVAYTGAYDAELVAREIAAGGHRTVGLVCASAMYHSFGARLGELLKGVALLDATDAIDRIKAVKSAEEIEFVRRTAAMQDEVMQKVREHIRPGMKEFEIMAYAQYIGQLLGSEQGIFLGSSAPPGQPAIYRPRSQQGRALRQGDTFMLLVENSGPGGYYTELARMFVLGKASRELSDAMAGMLEAQRHTVERLKPGTAFREIFEAHNAFMRGRGLGEERRLYSHSQGYDLVERPLTRQDETMVIAENMYVAVHPETKNERLYMTVCDNFLVGPGGICERLHRTSQEIIEV